jgi:hypothetical protein
MPEISERLYEKRDSTERFKMVPYAGPLNKWPDNKEWYAVSQKTGEKTLISSQEIQLWYRTVEAPPAAADDPPKK